MSETPTGKGHGNSSVGSFSQFRFETRTPRQRTHEATWKRLAETVPRTEDEWRLARQHVFSTAEEMSNTLTELLNPAKKTYLYEIIFLASRHTILCCDSEQRQMVYSDLRDFFSNPDLDDGMLERYMKSVVRLIKVLDELYLEGLLHRAFEAILYIPVQRSHLRHLTSARDALNSRLLGESEYHLFENAIKTKTFVPRLPPLPPLALPLCVVQHFDVFKLPSNLQSALSELAVQLRGYNPMPSSIPGETQMYAYEWPGANESMLAGLSSCDYTQVDSQTLTTSDRRIGLGILRDFTRRAEASDVLAPALVVQESGFRKFEWATTNRLALLINALNEPDDDRLHTLCDQDPLVVIICGLCLNKKKIRRMSQDLWDEVLRQAQTASKRLGPQLLHQTQINETVKGTSGNFKQRFDQIKRDVNSMKPRAAY
ncbi:hypothetical protein HZS61_004864 [Fusarium oxysporum f. sp. conglutinans]|uniref:Uncharacterized protein n=1 Tax=Fusarium oxysporum f. sp. conglutinans TaxID=100902 RepID=A0A8H6LEF1_FUSOX|nr:hypothetical protein HZS61_004864 [Fusarium oxysporum f. sp. conglutinans]